MIIKDTYYQCTSATFDDRYSIVRCCFDVAQYSDAQFYNYKIPFHNSLLNSVPKRRAEFLAGRYCAQQALIKLGIQNTFVDIGENRNPVWPVGIVGSISHDRDNAIAIVKEEKSSDSMVGIDIERWISESDLQSMRNMIVSDEEYDLLIEAGLDATQAITLGFSAKETFFKAAYKIVKKYFGFEEAKITEVHRSPHSAYIKLSISGFLKRKLLTRNEYKVNFFLESERVITICNH